MLDALRQPGLTQPFEVMQPGGTATLVICHADFTTPPRTGARPRLSATMLIVPDGARGLFPTLPAPRIEAGPGCRVCARAGCDARIAEPVIDRS